jgi:hypothetical protein
MELAADLQTDEVIDLACGYELDRELVDRAVSDSGSRHWESTRRRIRPMNVYQLTGFGHGKVAAEAYFKVQSRAPFARPHALCDARALRIAYEAATRESAQPASQGKARGKGRLGF